MLRGSDDLGCCIYRGVEHRNDPTTTRHREIRKKAIWIDPLATRNDLNGKFVCVHALICHRGNAVNGDIPSVNLRFDRDAFLRFKRKASVIDDTTAAD